MALQGTLDTFALPDVLRLLAATKKTGRLRITGGRGTGSVWAADGEVVGVEATHAPHAVEPVEALFELLRFEEGAFTFDADATFDAPTSPTDVEILLVQSEALLAEWRSIEAVVPSMDAWVTLRATLPKSEVVVDQAHWTTVVAVGGGATVRSLADELSLAELPISRAVKVLLELGLVEIADAAPAGAITTAPITTTPITTAPIATPLLARPLVAHQDDDVPAPPAPIAKSGPRARRARAAVAPAGPEVFVPLDLPGRGPASSYDQSADDAVEVEDAITDDVADHVTDEVADGTEDRTEDAAALADVVTAFPGLAGRTATPDEDGEDVVAAQQLGTDGERDAVLEEIDEDHPPASRGTLLKFLSSGKS